MRLLAGALGAAVVLAALGAAAAEKLPPPPARHFNDYAGLVSAADAERLDAKLDAFDKQSSNQILVVIYPDLPSPSLEDYTVRVAQSWKAGQGKLDNGVVVFVFVNDKKLRLEVGYGLEGALPDALSKRIIDERIAPGFREGQPARGLEAGIDAIIEVTRGEYKAEPRAGAGRAPRGGATLLVVFLFLVPLFVINRVMAKRMPAASFDGRGVTQGVPWILPIPRRRRRSYWDRGGWGGGGGFGGGGFGGGGGGFSGGGGSFGGGGASGSW